MKRRIIAIIVACVTMSLCLLMTGCNSRTPQYRIGVSQCLDDAWRQKMNYEMERELLLHPDMSLSRRIAYGSNELQCAQIDSFIKERVDLLIVSPNEAKQVQPAVTRAYRAGIPVIVTDRRVPGDEWTAFIGGAPANFAYHVSQFGLNGCAISAIGADELGDEIVDTFEKVHLNHILPVVEQPTGTVKVTLDDKGVPQYEICLGVAWDHIPLTNSMLEVAHQAHAACFGSLAQRSQTSRETIQAFLNAMPEDALKVFDINLRQSWYSAEVIAESLQRANVLKINDEELDVVATMLLGEPTVPGQLIAEDPEKTRRICREFIARYELDMIILTCGAIGSYVFTASKESYVATPKVQVADTVGAGDSFTATFVAQLLLGKSIREAHEKAVAVSAYVCTQRGAMPLLPEELKA